MPVLNYPVVGYKQNILRPIVFSVLKDLSKFTNMKNVFEVPFYYLDDSGVRIEIADLRFESSSEMVVEVSEEEFEQSIPLYQRHQPEFYPVFSDKDTKVDITPSYSTTVVSLSITGRFVSREAAKRWQNGMRDLLRNAIPGFQHNFEYGLVMPRGLLFILHQIYQKVLEREPDTEKNFMNWLKARFNPRMGTVSDVTGENLELALSEVAHQVHGFFKFDGQPEEGEKVDGVGSWNISFDYEFTYQRPNAISIYYPPAIYNQLLPDVLLGIKDREEPTVRTTQVEVPVENRHYSVSSMGLNALDEIMDKEQGKWREGVCVPYWDEFYVEQIYSLTGTKRFCDFLVLLDPEDDVGTVLLDLKELPEVQIRPDVLDFLLSEKPWLQIPGESLFQVMLYQWGKRREASAITINENLEVVLNTKLALKHSYHIRVAIYYDWNYLSDDAIKRIPDSLKPDIDDMLDKDNWPPVINPDIQGMLHLKTVQTFFTENYRGKIPFWPARVKEDING